MSVPPLRRYALGWLLLAAPTLAWAAGPDCENPDSWAERTICRDADLKTMEQRLAGLREQALLHSDNTDAFEADDARWRREKLDACTTVRCLDTTYRTRGTELQAVIAAGSPPLLVPGDYHRPDAADSPVLSVARLGARRYRLRVLPAPDAPPVAEGEFEERVGVARFEAGGCALDLNFAFDLIAVSGGGADCGAGALDGTYQRVAAEP